MNCEEGLVSSLTNVNLFGKTGKTNPKFCLLTIYGEWLLLIIGPLDKTKYVPANYLESGARNICICILHL